VAEQDAVVVGSGPNGLAAAITLAEAGRRVLVVEAADEPGGGARTKELTLPGFRHDVCSAIHPLGRASPFFASLPLAKHGLEWLEPEIQAAHALGGDRAAPLLRSMDETGEALGDRRGWRRLVGPLVKGWDSLAPHLLGFPLRPPRHPIPFLKFGVRSIVPAEYLTRGLLGSEASEALFAGIAAHSISPPSRLFTGAPGLVLAAAGHTVGWPVAKGGSSSIVAALVAHLESLGGRIETGRLVRRIEELPSADAVLFDTTPWQLVDIAGDRLPPRFRRRLLKFRHGSGSFKVDYALDGPMPWTAEACHTAGTVHLGGTMADVAAAESDVARGRHPDNPFVLVAQQSVVDPTRAPAGKHTLWAYCHVPFGSTVDMTDCIEAQLDRYAPGWRDLVLARVVKGPAELEAYSPNYIGGDIAGGASDGFQLLFRPRFGLHPYATPDPKIWLCSSSTPPGGAVHGACGHEAAKAVLAAQAKGRAKR
jgi:phytoene dehydrogenase-like protein